MQIFNFLRMLYMEILPSFNLNTPLSPIRTSCCTYLEMRYSFSEMPLSSTSMCLLDLYLLCASISWNNIDSRNQYWFGLKCIPSIDLGTGHMWGKDKQCTHSSGSLLLVTVGRWIRKAKETVNKNDNIWSGVGKSRMMWIRKHSGYIIGRMGMAVYECNASWICFIWNSWDQSIFGFCIFSRFLDIYTLSGNILEMGPKFKRQISYGSCTLWHITWRSFYTWLLHIYIYIYL
jgi:hypothetical protein